MGGPAAARWAELQSGRGIPPEILARASANPWHHEVSFFTPPAEPADTPSRRAAHALLPDGGSVLDVGCGGGAASFALADRAGHLTGVDQQQDMLDAFAAEANARGLPHRTVLGRWPGVAPAAGRADVVVCHHVLHNVVDLVPFLEALTAAARRGVVVEMMAQHPMAWLDPLWVRFHGLHRPEPATVDDAVAVLREIGISPDVQRWERELPPRQDPEWVARRLCLPQDAVPEVAEAIEALERPRAAATLSWTAR
ncbi:MAG TPA: class I SAM-dependent methyltransferase [Pseudonocardia sp.]|jgi:SAM-dependent methyltransferase|uniref:class I SAM-dependent methyltransferase n=1 Tax=Pseudonocardia sp. TaxID=60912 RepID=UPI002B4B889D|nr:class I SAM-dependent methyltransferase [Pseudonocardia sp.]HLU59504.1 class I SAM-dependent methyltransferase [Pseudonocardia sp.]